MSDLGLPQNFPTTVLDSSTNISAAQNAQVKPNTDADNSDKKKKIAVAIAVVSASALAIGTAAIMMNKNFKKAQQFFDNAVKQITGNNKILSEAIQNEDKAVQKFIDDNPEGYERIKTAILDIVDVKKAEDVVTDGILYHGTSLDSAKNIMENGVTPFSNKRVGSGSGMGYGFYSTPTFDAAKFYAEGGLVLPFKIDGNVAVLKDGVKSSDDLKLTVIGSVANILDPPPDNLSSMERMFRMPNQEAVDFANNNASYIITKAMQDLGIDAIYTNGATSRGGLLGSVLNQAPKFLDEAGQMAVFNGDSVKLDVDKLKELNPITRKNYRKFL